MANALTCMRILCSVVLLFCPALSPGFFTLYLIAGISDVLDGAAARWMNTASERGARLDSAADLVFAAVCLLKLLPAAALPGWVYGWAAVIALIRLVNVVSGFAVQKRLVLLHTAANKAAGILLFLLPFTLRLPYAACYAAAVCAVATFAAVQEGHYIRTRRAGG